LVIAPNKPSSYIAEKHGFILKETLKEEIYIDGKYFDDLKYYMLREEWLKKKR